MFCISEPAFVTTTITFTVGPINNYLVWFNKKKADR